MGLARLTFLALIIATSVAALALVHPPVAGWYLIPSTILILIGCSLIRAGWRRSRSILTPPVLGGLLIAWALGAAPILVAALDHRPAYAWIGTPLTSALAPVAWLHLLGVIVGFALVRLAWSYRALWPGDMRSVEYTASWHYRPRPILFATCLTAALVGFVIVRVGPGAFFTPLTAGQDVTFMAGLGLPLWLGESVFLILGLWGLLAMRRRNWKVGTVGLFLLCGAFLAVKLAFGGLHGSRSATVWGLLWLLLLFDSILRRVRRGEWAAILAGGLLFTYLYGFYKSVGAEARMAMFDQAVRSGIAADYNRSGEDVLLGDLSRAAVHGLLWERLESRSVAELGWGRTYLAAVTLWLPTGLIWERPPSKSVVGAAIEDDVSIASASELPGSRQYGITGETAINFGALGFTIGAAAFVMIMAFLQRHEVLAIATSSPASLLVSRLLSTLLVSLMLSDMDNWIVLLVRLTPLLAVIWLAVGVTARRRAFTMANPGSVAARA